MKTRSLLLVPFFVTSSLAGAVAADLGALKKEPPPPPIMYQVSPWTGFYGGLSAGYNWDTRRQDVTIPEITEMNSFRLNTGGGAIGTVFLGFNYQFARHWVIGLEIDGSFLRNVRQGQSAINPQYSGVVDLPSNDITFTGPQQGSWVLVPNLFSCYKVTGGQGTVLTKEGSQPCPSSTNNALNAWLPQTVFTDPNTGLQYTSQLNTGQVYVYQPGNNGGNYAGGNWSITRTQITSANVSASVQKRIEQLATLRGRFGFLPSESLLIYGTGGLAVGRVSSQLTATTTYTGGQTTYNCTDQIDPTVIPTVGAGCTAGGNQVTGTAGGSTNFIDTTRVRYSGVRVGFALGAGAEWNFMDNWKVRADYMYFNLGYRTMTAPAVAIITNSGPEVVRPSAKVKFDGHLARIGLVYQFSSGEARPIVAKY